MMLAPQADLEDGRLDVVLVSDAPKLRFLRLLPTVFNGSHVHQANVDVFRASSIEVASSRPFTLYADGDPIAELPVRIEILPAAVKTIVPLVSAG
jgi:diacylglycerol kinase family enzyme